MIFWCYMSRFPEMFVVEAVEGGSKVVSHPVYNFKFDFPRRVFIVESGHKQSVRHMKAVFFLLSLSKFCIQLVILLIYIVNTLKNSLVSAHCYFCKINCGNLAPSNPQPRICDFIRQKKIDESASAQSLQWYQVTFHYPSQTVYQVPLKLLDIIYLALSTIAYEQFNFQKFS